MLDNMSSSGIATAFIIYPQAIVNLTGSGVFNAVFGVIFYLMLVTLAIDSAFSIVEGVSASVSDKFKLDPKRTTQGICIIASVISLLYATRAGLAWLAIVDNWTNQINLILIGVLECIAVGWCFQTEKVVRQINRNTTKFSMPLWWFNMSVKYFSPIALSVLFVWNMYDLFVNKNGHYNTDYKMWAEITAGWVVSALVFVSGLFIRIIINHKKKNGFVEDEIIWEEED